MFVHYIDLAWRSFKRTPLVSILMVAAIAVGIGITMTSLSVYHMMSANPIAHKSHQLFQPQLNVKDADETWWSEDDLPYQLTYKDAMFLQNADIGLRKTAMLRTGFTVHLNDNELKPFLEPTRVASRDFFAMFERDFIYGGPWTTEQEQNAEKVVVIDASVNERLFGGKNSVGEQLYLDDHAFTIVGVTPIWDIYIKYYDLNNGDFNEPEPIFIPNTLIPVMEIQTWGNTNGWKYEEIQTYQDLLQSESSWLQFWVELDSPERAAQYKSFIEDYLAEQGKTGRYTRDDISYAMRDVEKWLTYNNVVSEDNKVLVGLSFMFLLVCLANILGLLLGKFLRRAPEVGVRRALGASKTQVFMQHLVEVSVLGFLGGLLGIALAQLGLWGVRQTYSYYSDIATMDLSMLLAAPIIAVLACILAGMYPAWLVCRTTPAIYLKTQ